MIQLSAQVFWLPSAELVEAKTQCRLKMLQAAHIRAGIVVLALVGGQVAKQLVHRY
jgi:hypothetical protein